MNSNKQNIQQLVTIQADIEKMKNGQKTTVRRNNRYGEIGDSLQLDSYTFRLKNVYEQKLGDMTEANAKEEGFEGLQQYKDKILAIHDNMEWDPSYKVWVHELERV